MVSTRAETDFVECLLYRPDNGIDCGCDVGLFRTLAAIGHSNTLEQQERSMRVRVKIVAFATDKNEWGTLIAVIAQRRDTFSVGAIQ
jgi:hypothetical protein